MRWGDVMASKLEYRIALCVNCGKQFEGMMYGHRRLCDDCRKSSANDAQMRLREDRKSERLKRKRKKKPKTLNEIMREIKEYNDTHETQITYGQYVSMMGD